MSLTWIYTDCIKLFTHVSKDLSPIYVFLNLCVATLVDVCVK